MNAQEHFRVAEHLITAPDGAAKPREREIALAQVHATLALPRPSPRPAGSASTRRPHSRSPKHDWRCLPAAGRRRAPSTSIGLLPNDGPSGPDPRVD